MRNNVKNIMSTILVFVLVVGCFAALPLTTRAAPVSGVPAWKESYNGFFNTGTNNLKGEYYDRGNASGDKISSNAHSGDYPGVYFRWDEKQKCPGVFLVADWVFDLFEDGTFYLTAKNSNSYYKYTINRDTGCEIEDGVYAYGIPKEVMAKDNKGNDKKDELKNINMVFIDGTYKNASFDIVKCWYDEDGNVITDRIALDAALNFNGSYKLGANVVKITDYNTAVYGKKIAVTEIVPSGFVEIHGKASQTITVKCGDNPTQVVKFENQKQLAEIEIVKVWLDAAGDEITDSVRLAELSAQFTINGEDANLGINTVKEGTYIVSETRCTKGFKLVSENDVEFSIDAGGKVTVTFCNREIQPPILKKTVDGIDLSEWFEQNKFTDEEKKEITEGMIFELYDTELSGNGRVRSTRVDDVSGAVSSDGIITFDFDALLERADPEGWYAVVETFVPGSLAAKLFSGDVDPLIIYIGTDGKTAKFDYTVKYTIINGYKNQYIKNLGYSGLYQNGNIFYIGVTNTKTGQVYASYCANALSSNFAGDKEGGNSLDCTGYKVAYSMKVSEPAYLAAFNYIEDTYGNLNENRVITQTVIWALLDAVNVNSASFIYGTSLTAAEKAAVIDVLDNSIGYTGNGKIVDVAFMECDKHHSYDTCQPQIVPIYREYVLNNLVRNDPDLIGVSFTKVKTYGSFTEKIAAENEFAFELQKYNEVTDEWVSIDTFYTDDSGVVSTGDILDVGSYKFVEVGIGGVWEPVVIFFTVDNVEDTLVATWDEYTVECPIIVNTPTLDKKYTSVTAANEGNPIIVPNSNHFTYAVISIADLNDGPVKLDMVEGNKNVKVGEAIVELDDAGKLVITINGEGVFGALAFNDLSIMPTNGNIQSLKIFNHDNNTELSCPEGDIIYLYIHCDSIQFYNAIIAW